MKYLHFGNKYSYFFILVIPDKHKRNRRKEEIKIDT